MCKTCEDGKLVQKYYHQMKFNTEDGWSKHTPHVMLTSKAQRFVQSEYTRTQNCNVHDERFLNLNDSSEVHDPHCNQNNSAIKCRAKEKLAIANYISILSMTKETSGRKYDRKDFIDALGKVEVKLDDKDEEARAKRRMEQARSEDEGTMAAIINEIFDTANRPADADDSNTEIYITFNSGGDLIVNGINQGHVTDEDNNGNLDNGNVNDDENIVVKIIFGDKETF